MGGGAGEASGGLGWRILALGVAATCGFSPKGWEESCMLFLVSYSSCPVHPMLLDGSCRPVCKKRLHICD